MIKQAKVKIVPTAWDHYGYCQKIIHPKDIHILSTALTTKADFLITLDRKHFMNPKIKKAKLLIKILTPKDFLQKYL